MMSHKQHGFILVYLLFVLVLVCSSTLTLGAQYERMRQAQIFEQAFVELLEKSVLETSKH